mmetsp:Transcript_3546/g.22284  ORF Transcript_3546/g.22284 Transcript_3546/m.22284 type:complete len:458 (-) Transcript_3546:3043-4416(-)
MPTTTVAKRQQQTKDDRHDDVATVRVVDPDDTTCTTRTCVLRFADGNVRHVRRFGRGTTWTCVDEHDETHVAARRAKETCAWALAIYRSDGRSLEVRDVPNGALRMMAARGAGGEVDRDDEDEATDDDARAKKETKRKKLVHVFGSQKRKRQEMRRDASRVETGKVGDAHVQANLQAAVAQQVERWNEDGPHVDETKRNKPCTKEEWMERAAKEARKTLPCHVEEATDPKRAYPIDRVLPAALLPAIEEMAESLLQAARNPSENSNAKEMHEDGWDGSVLDGQGWPNYLKKHADAWLAQAKTEEEEIVLRRVLGYLTMLLVFHAAGGQAKNAKHLAEKLNFTTEAAGHLLSRFMEETRQQGGGTAYQKSRNSTLSLQYHILLLLLVLHKYTMDPKDVPGLLRLSMKEVLQRCRELGADYRISTTKGEKHYVVRLLPNNSDGETLKSKFPALKIGRGR